MGQTSNYGLSQWTKPDLIQMEDFNSDNAKVDTVLKSLADSVASHGAALAQKGNINLEHFTYTGTGGVGDNGSPTTFTFPHEPLLYFIIGSEAILWGGKPLTYATSNLYVTSSSKVNMFTVTQTWNGNTVSLSISQAAWQMNIKNTVYHVFSFYTS